jgi:hypothetical protein
MTEYPPPVAKLLTRGGPPRDAWPNYLALGLGPEHVSDLIRLAADPIRNQAYSDSPEVWAPQHAWRALGQLRAEQAVAPLLALLAPAEENDDDWALEELPKVFGMIGPPAIPALIAYLADTVWPLYARVAAAGGLEQVAKHHPDARPAVVEALSGQLEGAVQNDPSFNGFLLSYLLELNAVEAAPVIERAFAADAVDESIAGDWEDVQWELGLRDTPPDRRRYDPTPMLPLGPPASRPTREQKAKAKAKRKQAAKSRKRNRKRK